MVRLVVAVAGAAEVEASVGAAGAGVVEVEASVEAAGAAGATTEG